MNRLQRNIMKRDQRYLRSPKLNIVEIGSDVGIVEIVLKSVEEIGVGGLPLDLAKDL